MSRSIVLGARMALDSDQCVNASNTPDVSMPFIDLALFLVRGPALKPLDCYS